MKSANETEDTDYQDIKKESLATEIKAYIEARVQLLTLSIAEKISLIVAHSLQKMLGLILMGTAIYFIFLALGFYLGELLGSNSLGFGIVSLPFLILGLIFINRKSKKLTEKIQADIISKMIQDGDSTEDEKNEDHGGVTTGQKE